MAGGWPVRRPLRVVVTGSGDVNLHLDVADGHLDVPLVGWVLLSR
jgi:hypothetical protein